MKLICRLLLGLSLACSSSYASANPSSIVQVNAGETFLGDIVYQGGLLYRGQMNLQQPTEINVFRLEIPAFCKASPFEVGFVVNNMFESAEAVDVKNHIYRSRSGQAIRANGIYVSLNGEQLGNCHVLVFRVNGGGTPPPTSQNYVSCVTNPLSYSVIFSAQSAIFSQNVTIAPYSSVALVTNVPAGSASLSKVVVSFDQDLGVNYDPINYQLEGAWQGAVNCDTAPTYDFRSVYFNRIGLFRR